MTHGKIVTALRLHVHMTQSQTAVDPASAPEKEPWAALFSLCLGFFMILVDMTIVSVATPTIITKLHATTNAVIWVTSAYALAYAVPVLITGRLGDRFGPRRLYMLGLTVFTLSSLWCGLTGSIGALITARVVQGLGAAMMTPQTMAIITRIFPASGRGRAMAVWGATSGVAMVVGPVVGGGLTDWLGWQWIFFINVPVGVVGYFLALRFVPVLETHSHKFDWLGVALSGAGMFLLVFGIQEGQQKHWAGWIIAFILGGIVVIALFLVWQRFNRNEPLVPLGLFSDRNYSVANVIISVMGCIFTGMGFPLILYAEAVRGDSPVKAALLLLPMAVMALLLAKTAGDLTDKLHPRLVVGTGLGLNALSFFWLAAEMKDNTNIWLLILPMALMGIGGAFIWAPNTATATRNLPIHQAGAGAGVYNATRQVGGAIGSAAMAVLIDSRITALLGAGASGGSNADAGSSQLPAMIRAPFARAMSESMLLPAFVGVLGFIVVWLYERPNHAGFGGSSASAGH